MGSERFYSETSTKKDLEEIAVYKFYKPGKCSNSCFAAGGHRCGMIPTERIRDGGLPGVVCQSVCIECGKKFKETCFYPSKDPEANNG
jgi:hypothetical protein